MTRSAGMDVAALPLPTSSAFNGRLAFNTSDIHYLLPVVQIALPSPAATGGGFGQKLLTNPSKLARSRWQIASQLGVSTGSDIVLFTHKFGFGCWAFSARIEFARSISRSCLRKKAWTCSKNVTPAANASRPDDGYCSRMCTLWPSRLVTTPHMRPAFEPPICC